MISESVYCPHCVATRMTPRTNYAGGVYLECCDCGYYDAVQRRNPPDGEYVPVPDVARFPAKISREQGLRSLREEYARLGRAPKARECGRGCPSHDWFRKNFGGLQAACELVGIPPNRGGNPTGKNGRKAA